MTDILRRELAPIAGAAWAEIDEEAQKRLRTHLSARFVVDFSGPHGWELASVNLGRLEIEKKPAGEVTWGQRRILPLVEIRVPFKLKQLELDNVLRGSKDAGLDALAEAARSAARFENNLVFNGFKAGGIKGICEQAGHKPLTLPKSPEDIPETIAKAKLALEQVGVEGPYALVLGTEAYTSLTRSTKIGFPIYRVVNELVDGNLTWSPEVEGGLLLSKRGGDFELTVGQDLSIGYASHNRDEVELYFTESLAFRVLDPDAAILLQKKS